MMIEINTHPLEDQNLRYRLERIGDLINIDGPLLSLFKDSLSNALYLLDWVDNDELYNRWLIVKAEPVSVYSFVNKKIPYKQLFDSATQYYVTDIKNKQNPPFDIQKLEKLPTVYRPNVNSFFDESDSKNIHKITSVLNDLLKEDKGRVRDMWNNSVVYHLEPYYNLEKQKLSTEVKSRSQNNITDKKYRSILLRQNNDKPNKFLRPTGLALY